MLSLVTEKKHTNAVDSREVVEIRIKPLKGEEKEGNITKPPKTLSFQKHSKRQ